MPLWSETTGAPCLPAVQNRSLSPAELDLWDESSRSTTMNIWRAAWPKQKGWNFQRFPFLGFFRLFAQSHPVEATVDCDHTRG
jgi:hypothetical protein